jgi:hypothetical protein
VDPQCSPFERRPRTVAARFPDSWRKRPVSRASGEDAFTRNADLFRVEPELGDDAIELSVQAGRVGSEGTLQ